MKNPGSEDLALIEKESGVRSQESVETIGVVENWNNGMMGLRAKNFLIIWLRHVA
jgi:hypothetical protein